MLEELADGEVPVPDPLADPDLALALVQSGTATEDELVRLRERAQRMVHHAVDQDHLESIGALVIGPPSAAESMRRRRHEQAERWQVVLDAIVNERAAP
jgi:hypothetical protein